MYHAIPEVRRQVHFISVGAGLDIQYIGIIQFRDLLNPLGREKYSARISMAANEPHMEARTMRFLLAPATKKSNSSTDEPDRYVFSSSSNVLFVIFQYF